MRSLERLIKKDRKRRYKRLKKIFKARDTASKYISEPITISRLDKYFGNFDVDYNSKATLAKMIVDGKRMILGITKRPSKPVVPKK